MTTSHAISQAIFQTTSGGTANPPKSTAGRSTPTHPAWLIVAASLWLASAANIPLWLSMHELSMFSHPSGWLFAVALGLIIAAALASLASLLAWRWTLKPVLVLLVVSAACGAYFMIAYHVVIDSTMMANAVQTDARELRDLLSMKLFATVTVLGVFPAVVIWRWPVDYGLWRQRTLHNILQITAAAAVLVLLILVSFSPLASAMRNHKELRYMINPLNSLYALGQQAMRPLRQADSTLEPRGLDAYIAARPASARPPLLVLVLGETGRSGNFGLNGYARDTTPELARHQVASFRNAWSCGTSTAASVPCMFSGLGRDNFEATRHPVEGLLDIVQRAGMAVLWVDNQSGCKGVCDRVPTIDTSTRVHPELCPKGECYDGIMLEGLDQHIAALPAARRANGVVVVLHQMGSHGPAYHLRSPPGFKRFKPECTDNDLQSCTQAELVNAYDNSIAYTDHFLASTIAWLTTQQRSYDTAMVYLADHGESLGEKNLYLHGMPYIIAPDVQKHVPWITWLSDSFASHVGTTSACWHAGLDRRMSHDNYFHSVLGLVGIRGSMYQRALDVYAPCIPDAPNAALAMNAKP